LVTVVVIIDSQSQFDPQAQDPGAFLQAALTASTFFWLSGFCLSASLTSIPKQEKADE
jgi:hypothetical protein